MKKHIFFHTIGKYKNQAHIISKITTIQELRCFIAANLGDEKKITEDMVRKEILNSY